MKATRRNTELVFKTILSQLEDENGRGEFDNETDLLEAAGRVIGWLEDEKKNKKGNKLTLILKKENTPPTILEKLNTRKLYGSANKCPHCKKTGKFGSIARFIGGKGKNFLICGWCGKISKAK